MSRNSQKQAGDLAVALGIFVGLTFGLVALISGTGTLLLFVRIFFKIKMMAGEIEYLLL